MKHSGNLNPSRRQKPHSSSVSPKPFHLPTTDDEIAEVPIQNTARLLEEMAMTKRRPNNHHLLGQRPPMHQSTSLHHYHEQHSASYGSSTQSSSLTQATTRTCVIPDRPRLTSSPMFSETAASMSAFVTPSGTLQSEALRALCAPNPQTPSLIGPARPNSILSLPPIAVTVSRSLPAVSPLSTAAQGERGAQPPRLSSPPKRQPTPESHVLENSGLLTKHHPHSEGDGKRGSLVSQQSLADGGLYGTGQEMPPRPHLTIPTATTPPDVVLHSFPLLSRSRPAIPPALASHPPPASGGSHYSAGSGGTTLPTFSLEDHFRSLTPADPSLQVSHRTARGGGRSTTALSGGGHGRDDGEEGGGDGNSHRRWFAPSATVTGLQSVAEVCRLGYDLRELFAAALRGEQATLPMWLSHVASSDHRSKDHPNAALWMHWLQHGYNRESPPGVDTVVRIASEYVSGTLFRGRRNKEAYSATLDAIHDQNPLRQLERAHREKWHNTDDGEDPATNSGEGGTASHLTSEDRVWLRRALAQDGLTSSDLANIYRIPASTVSSWLSNPEFQDKKLEGYMEGFLKVREQLRDVFMQMVRDAYPPPLPPPDRAPHPAADPDVERNQVHEDLGLDVASSDPHFSLRMTSSGVEQFCAERYLSHSDVCAWLARCEIFDRSILRHVWEFVIAQHRKQRNKKDGNHDIQPSSFSVAAKKPLKKYGLGEVGAYQDQFLLESVIASLPFDDRSDQRNAALQLFRNSGGGGDGGDHKPSWRERALAYPATQQFAFKQQAAMLRCVSKRIADAYQPVGLQKAVAAWRKDEIERHRRQLPLGLVPPPPPRPLLTPVPLAAPSSLSSPAGASEVLRSRSALDGLIATQGLIGGNTEADRMVKKLQLQYYEGSPHSASESPPRHDGLSMYPPHSNHHHSHLAGGGGGGMAPLGGQRSHLLRSDWLVQLQQKKSLPGPSM